MVWFILAIVFSFVGQVMYFPNDVNMAIGRILAACLLFIVFIRCFQVKKQFSGFVMMLPALLFAIWNVFNHIVTNGEYGAVDYAIILGIAPALFEEVLFREIFIHNLKSSGQKPLATLLISALVFGAIHLTNIVGMAPAQVLVQVGYSVVVGLVFGAIYIKSDDLISVVMAHAAIDITGKIFLSASEATIPMLIAFVILLLGEAAYAFWLLLKDENKAISD